MPDLILKIMKYNTDKTYLQIVESYSHLANQIIKRFENIIEETNDKNIQKIDTQRNVAYIFETENEKLIIKIYFHGGLVRFFLPAKWFLKNRGLSEFLFCFHNLTNLDFIPQYIGALWNKRFFFYITGTISKYLPNTIDLREVITSPKISRTTKKTILAKVGMTIKKMHEHGIYHRDLHLKNILIQQNNTENEEYKIFIIDFDKASIKKNLGLFWRTSNLLRLKRYFIKNKLPIEYFNFILEGYNIGKLSITARILSLPHLLWAKLKSYVQ